MPSPKNVWDILEIAAAMDPSATAMVAERPLDYGALKHTVTLLSDALRREGVGPGDRVALMELNTPFFLVWTFACAGVGAVLVPLNCRLAAP